MPFISYVDFSSWVYQKAAVIKALNDMGANVKASAKDAAVIKAINALSDEDTAKLMEAIKDSKASVW